MTETTSRELSADAWTLVADGDTGATSVLIQPATATPALIYMASSPPDPALVMGIVIQRADAPFAAALLPGQNVYAKAAGSATTIVAMVG